MEGYPQEEMQTIYHSSHLHALQLIPASDHGHHHTRCCDPTASTMINTNRISSNPVYGCRPCNFYIHKNCAELLPYIRHPSHPSHTLTLLHASPYLEGTTECDACCKPIDGRTGFSYHCTNCSFDLHTHCAFLPTTINSPTSHPHLLSLRFSDAFSFTIYKCDLCRRTIEAKAWLYYCVPCDFQAHTDCVLARRGGSAAPRPAGQLPNPLTEPAIWPGQVGAPNWSMGGQPSSAASHLSNPLSGLTPAIWPAQVGVPSVSSGLNPSHNQPAVPAQGTHSVDSSLHMDGQTSTAAGQPRKPVMSGSTPAIWPGEGGAPNGSSGLDTGCDQATAPAQGTQGNRFEGNHGQGGLVHASDVGNSTQAGAPEMTTQQSGNDGGMSDFIALQLEMMKLQVGLNNANTVNNFISNYTWRPRYW